MRLLWLWIVLGVVLALALCAVLVLGLHRKPNYMSNFELNEFDPEGKFISPTLEHDGLAIYSVGSGDPVLLMPYPHSQTVEPMAQGQLAQLLLSMGRQVVSFDLPGTYRSTRLPTGTMDEMIECAEEALGELGIDGSVDVVGHSMSGLSALAFAVERPERTQRLVLIGSVSGMPAAIRWGLPGSYWKVYEADYWRVVIWGMRLTAGRGDLALHKRLHNLMGGVCYYSADYFEPLTIDEDDRSKGSPIRQMLWVKNMYRKLSYADRLDEVSAPTLVLVGRHDPETPVAAAEELVGGINGSELVVFDRSGHSPHEEEPVLVGEAIGRFWQR
jgi:proline iminopeptidase